MSLTFDNSAIVAIRHREASSNGSDGMLPAGRVSRGGEQPDPRNAAICAYSKLSGARWQDLCRLARWPRVRLPRLCRRCWGKRDVCRVCRAAAVMVVMVTIEERREGR